MELNIKIQKLIAGFATLFAVALVIVIIVFNIDNVGRLDYEVLKQDDQSKFSPLEPLISGQIYLRNYDAVLSVLASREDTMYDIDNVAYLLEEVDLVDYLAEQGIYLHFGANDRLLRIQLDAAVYGVLGDKDERMQILELFFVEFFNSFEIWDMDFVESIFNDVILGVINIEDVEMGDEPMTMGEAILFDVVDIFLFSDSGVIVEYLEESTVVIRVGWAVCFIGSAGHISFELWCSCLGLNVE